MASGVLASGALLISTNFGGFITGLNQTSNSFSGWAKGIGEKMFLLSSGLAGALAAFGIPPVVGQQLQNVANDIDNVSKKSRSLGIPVDQFIGLQHAAGLSGVGVQQLETGLRTMATKMSDAVGGNAQAQRSFQQLGISMDELRTLSPDQVLQRVADGMQGVGNQADRLAIAGDLFGSRAGLQFLPLLEGGSEAIRSMVGEAERLGIAVGPQQAQAIEAMNDAWTRVQTAIKGVWTQLLVALTPLLTQIANLMTNIWVAIQPVVVWVGQFIGAAWDIVVAAITQIWDAFVGLVGQFADWDAVGATFIQWFGNAKTVATTVLKGIGIGLAYVFDVLKVGAGFIIRYLVTPLVSGFGVILQAIQNALALAARLPLVGERFRAAAESVGQFRASVQSTAGGISDVGSELLNTEIGSGATAVNQFFDNLENRNQQATAAVTRSNPANAMSEAMAKLTEDINKAFEKLDTEFAQFGLNEGEKQLADFRARGASEEQLAGLQERLARNAAQSLEFNADPTLKMQQELGRLDALLASGQLSFHAYSVAANNAMTEAERALNLGGEAKLPTAVTFGSSAFTDMVIRSQQQAITGQEDPAARQERILAEQRNIQQQSLDQLVQIAQAMIDSEELVL